jgi:hypothetical protein
MLASSSSILAFRYALFLFLKCLLAFSHLASQKFHTFYGKFFPCYLSPSLYPMLREMNLHVLSLQKIHFHIIITNMIGSLTEAFMHLPSFHTCNISHLFHSPSIDHPHITG